MLALARFLHRVRSAAQLPLLALRSVTLPAPTQPSRFAHLPRIFRRAALLFIPPVLLLTLLTVRLLHNHAAQQAQIESALDTSSQPALELASTSSLQQRPVFPFSIIPGGVRDVHELQSAVTADPVVAKHYSDFHVTQARVVRLKQPLAMYVSYRRKNQVYWTKNRMTIPAGETLISDGENLARVRCGNRLSAIAVKPVSAGEPTKEELETPEFLPPLMAQFLPGEDGNFFPGAIPAIAPGPGGKRGASGPPIFPPGLPPGVSPIVPNTPIGPPPPPVSTPEPSSLALLFGGAVLTILFCAFSLRRNGSA